MRYYNIINYITKERSIFPLKRKRFLASWYGGFDIVDGGNGNMRAGGAWNRIITQCHQQQLAQGYSPLPPPSNWSQWRGWEIQFSTGKLIDAQIRLYRFLLSQRTSGVSPVIFLVMLLSSFYFNGNVVTLKSQKQRRPTLQRFLGVLQIWLHQFLFLQGFIKVQPGSLKGVFFVIMETKTSKMLPRLLKMFHRWVADRPCFGFPRLPFQAF